MKPLPRLLPALFLATAAAHAGPRSSQNYTIPTDTTDAGGKRATSAAYTHDGSAGGIAGISTVASPVQTAKHGYLGQLAEVTALQLAATPATVEETATRQISAAQVLDDDSRISMPATSVTWSVQSGPLTGIDASGLATAGVVYQDSAAVAQGSYAGATGTLSLTVLETIPDNFGSYAGDQLADDWQFQYFGLNNPLAAALLDPDGDGQNNRFEYIAGLIPTDPVSRFLLHIETVPGEPDHKQLKFSPTFLDRTYTVQSNTTLTGGTWEALTNFSDDNQNPERTVIDQDATDPAKFYKVEITKP